METNEPKWVNIYSLFGNTFINSSDFYCKPDEKKTSICLSPCSHFHVWHCSVVLKYLVRSGEKEVINSLLVILLKRSELLLMEVFKQLLWLKYVGCSFVAALPECICRTLISSTLTDLVAALDVGILSSSPSQQAPGPHTQLLPGYLGSGIREVNNSSASIAMSWCICDLSLPGLPRQR